MVAEDLEGDFLMSFDLDKLEATAKAATQGEWLYGADIPGHPEVDGYLWSPPIGEARHVAEVRGYGSGLPMDENGRHIAAFAPPTALILIERARDREHLMNQVSDMHEEMVEQQLTIRQLQEDVEMYEAMKLGASDRIAALEAKLDEYRADAEKWQSYQEERRSR